jgi:hypothetical protein
MAAVFETSPSAKSKAELASIVTIARAPWDAFAESNHSFGGVYSRSLLSVSSFGVARLQVRLSINSFGDAHILNILS